MLSIAFIFYAATIGLILIFVTSHSAVVTITCNPCFVFRSTETSFVVVFFSFFLGGGGGGGGVGEGLSSFSLFCFRYFCFCFVVRLTNLIASCVRGLLFRLVFY